MQFITNGPDVPDALLEAHEEGRVVFFCGAGISYPANLPSFKSLVERVRIALHTDYNDIEKELLSHNQFDLILNSFEHRVAGKRERVRQALASSLQPDYTLPGALDTHRALLTLSTDTDRQVRLVTTNFDRIFDEVIRLDSLKVEQFSAPMLPVPKRTKWDGLVYLHGQLPEPLGKTGLDRLVVTSGDFGLAYLAERWAARFVSELLQNFVVCFVGYSLNDPVLRYMMDALAADKLLGEAETVAYAFGNFDPGWQERVHNEWVGKGVVPVLYESHPGGDGHAALHRTLIEWAATARAGTLGKKSIVSRLASATVTKSTEQDNFAGRMVWALSDRSGIPAQHFAEMTPTPSLAWLEPLTDRRFAHADLSRYGVPTGARKDEALRFSVLARPSPYEFAAPMRLAHDGGRAGGYDKVMFQLVNWLLRHLNNSELLLWIANQGGALHDQFKWALTNRFRYLDNVVVRAATEYEQFCLDSPDAVPGSAMRPLWELLLQDRFKTGDEDANFYGWIGSFKQAGLTWALRKQLVELLTSRVSITRRFSFEPAVADPVVASQVVGWELVLRSSDIAYALGELRADAAWTAVLPGLLDDFDRVLQDAMEVKALLRGPNELSDRSYSALPSIEDHPQNERVEGWGVLILLVRDSWLGLNAQDPDRAAAYARLWWAQPSPVFKRLALFVAAKTDRISPDDVADWLCSDGGIWLWSAETQREMMRYLALRGKDFSASSAKRLERLMLEGPASVLQFENPSEERAQQIVRHLTHVLLAKAYAGGMSLSQEACEYLVFNLLQEDRSSLSIDQREEFPVWMSSGFDDYGDRTAVSVAPKRRRELEAWLGAPRQGYPWGDDGWRDRCKSDFPVAVTALMGLASRDVWPVDRWRTALQAWSEDALKGRAWKRLAPCVVKMPAAAIRECRNGVSFWIRSVAPELKAHRDVFFQLIERVLEEGEDAAVDVGQDLFGNALNHPVGYAADALMSWWYSTTPQDNQPLPQKMGAIVADLLGGRRQEYAYGRVMLAAHAVSLFRADPDWAKRHLIPLFDWTANQATALLVWTGYLASPRFYRAFLDVMKEPFLATAAHFDELGGMGNRYVELLTQIGLDSPELFGAPAMRTATGTLPQKGLDHAAQFLMRLMKGAQEPAEYWRSRVTPYLHGVWPADERLISTSISASFARAAIAAGVAFPAAVDVVRTWVRPLPRPNGIGYDLKATSHCTEFPGASLKLLCLVVPEQLDYPPPDVLACFDAIKDAGLSLVDSEPYRKLQRVLRPGG